MIDHNPFYLLSGLLMLAGCYAISVDTHGQPDALQPLLWLIVVLVIYQATALGLGLWLSQFRRGDAGLRRDTMQLTIVWTVLSLDAPLLYHELFTRSLTAGTAMACIGATWSLAGLAAIGWLMKLRLSRIAWGLLVADVVLVHVIPGWYRSFAESGFLPELTEFRAAWLLGLWIAIHALAPDWSRGPRKWSPRNWSPLRWTLLLLPLASVIAHVYVANWTYSRHAEEAFDLHHLPPLLLGVAAIIARLGRTDEGRRRAKTAAIGVASVAVAASVLVSPPCPLEWRWLDDMTILVPGLAITGFAALLLWTWLLHRNLGPLLVGYLAAASAFTLHAPPPLTRIAKDLLNWLWRRVPDDGSDWGVIAVTLAFVTLALGAAVSLWPRRRPDVQT